MSYTKRLPDIQDIKRLSTLVYSYPSSRAEVVKVARMWNYKDEVITFLRQFPVSDSFNSRTDLVAKSEELSKTIRNQWESTPQLRIQF